MKKLIIFFAFVSLSLSTLAQSPYLIITMKDSTEYAYSLTFPPRLYMYNNYESIILDALNEYGDYWSMAWNFADIKEYTLNNYVVTYMIDGYYEYDRDYVQVGQSIPLKDVPSRDGRSFGGWQNVPNTMLAEDITIYGGYLYALHYVVDGETVKTDSIAYGTPLNVEPLEKEGYTFSGWDGLLYYKTMPACDLTIYGSFSLNYYTLTYLVDGEYYTSISIGYGKNIPQIAPPTKEGHTFSGWSEIPTTMPAHDVTITGSFTPNIGTGIEAIDAAICTVNPTLARTAIMVTYNGAEAIQDMYIVTLTGQRINVDIPFAQQMQIDVTNLPATVYMLCIQTDTQLITRRFIRKN